MPGLKAPRRRALVRKIRLWLHRPATFKVAVVALQVFNVAVRLLNLFK